MKTTRLINTSEIPFVNNRLDGESAVNQISALLEMNEILTDAFSATYQSEYFRLGEKQTRFNIVTIQTVFNMVIKDLMESSLLGIEVDRRLDWSRLEVHKGIDDLACDINTYLEYSSAFITVFDCFFNHDSMQGESPESFIQKSLQIRNFFLLLLGNALRAGISNGACESAILYPSHVA